MNTLRSLPLADLARHGRATAVVGQGVELTYSQLNRRVQEIAGAFGAGRRLVVIEMSNTLDSVVAYLAAMRQGHVVALAEPGRAEAITRQFAPDTIVRSGRPRLLHDEPAHTLHPDLGLLLSTSGSTSATKLVRLSYQNLQANAEAIAGALQLRPDDRAASTLPLHYTYGLSVLHSHLAVGASVALTTQSVTAPGFLAWLRDQAVTTMPGVPHTYELLDRIGLDTVDLPTLRLLTQAGGRLAPERVQHWAEMGQRKGFDFIVMYGQTEATARMAYLPADLARTHPDSVGRPIPGGTFRLRPVAGVAAPVGELVYRGPNVMMGYASDPDDLERGSQINELATGDLATIDASGLVRLVGRTARFAKIYGLRVDLDRVERRLGEAGYQVAAADLGDHLGVLWATGEAPTPGLLEQSRLAAAAAAGLPLPAVVIRQVEALPRNARGKVDATKVVQLLGPPPDTDVLAAMPTARSARPHDRIEVIYGNALGLEPADIADSATFVSLGGDSLSYVWVATRLAAVLGELPEDWHVKTITQLRAEAAASDQPGQGSDAGPTSVVADDSGTQTDGIRRVRWWRVPATSVETTILLRATAIIVVVGSHVGVMDIRGGAHLLLVLAGISFTRFQLTVTDRRERLRRGLVNWRSVAVPSAIWLAAVATLGQEYGPSLLFGVNLFGPDTSAPEWRYWFVEAFLFVWLVATAIVAVPWVHKQLTRRPFEVAAVVLGGTLLLRWAFATEDGPTSIYTPVVVGWLFGVGWALGVARHRWQQAFALAALGVGLIGYFDQWQRAALVAGGTMIVVMVPRIRLPITLASMAATVASASLFIYLTHWQTYPPFLTQPWLALLVALASGVLIERGYRRLHRTLGRYGPGPRRLPTRSEMPTPEAEQSLASADAMRAQVRA